MIKGDKANQGNEVVLLQNELLAHLRAEIYLVLQYMLLKNLDQKSIAICFTLTKRNQAILAFFDNEIQLAQLWEQLCASVRYALEYHTSVPASYVSSIEAAVKIAAKLYGDKHPALGEIHLMEAIILTSMGKVKEAETQLEKALTFLYGENNETVKFDEVYTADYVNLLRIKAGKLQQQLK